MLTSRLEIEQIETTRPVTRLTVTLAVVISVDRDAPRPRPPDTGQRGGPTQRPVAVLSQIRADVQKLTWLSSSCIVTPLVSS